MNNFTFGDSKISYYETIAGGKLITVKFKVEVPGLIGTVKVESIHI